MLVNKQCEDCKVNFQYDEKPGYPRKYCPNCSAKRKAEYEAKKQNKVAQAVPVAQSNAVLGVTQGISEVRHIFQNAYEFGKAGDRLTIRFWDVEDFKRQVKELQTAKEELGLFEIEKI